MQFALPVACQTDWTWENQSRGKITCTELGFSIVQVEKNGKDIHTVIGGHCASPVLTGFAP
jgi:hypothetical protein